MSTGYPYVVVALTNSMVPLGSTLFSLGHDLNLGDSRLTEGFAAAHHLAVAPYASDKHRLV